MIGMSWYLNISVLAILAAFCACSRGTDHEKRELSKYLPNDFVDSLSVTKFKQKSFSTNPELFCQANVGGESWEKIMKFGFRAQDSDELRYVQKVFADEFGSGFRADTSDRLYGVERQRFDIKIIRRGASQCFIWVIKH